MRQIARGYAFALLVGLLGAAWVAPAHAAGSSGDRTGGAVVTQKADGDSLTYDGFTGFNCSQGGFFTSATGHLNVSGPVTVEGKTFLNGQLYDSYSLDLGTGPATFPTSFDRTFATPTSSSKYKFVFSSQVRRGTEAIGDSVTTISCDAGAFAAVNAFLTFQAIPAGEPATWAALALALAALGALALARRRA